MRLTRYINCLVVILCITSNGFAQMRTKDAMAKHIFEMFKNMDSNGYTKMIPRLTVFKQMIKEAWCIDSATAIADKEDIDAMNNQDLRDIRDFAKMEFNTLVDGSTKKGVDWKNAIMTGWEENKDDDSYEEAAPFTTFAGIISFTSVGKKYKIEFKRVLWSKKTNSWYAPNTYAVYEEGKEIEGTHFGRGPGGCPKF